MAATNSPGLAAPILDWIAAAPDAALDALLHNCEQHAVLAAAFSERASRTGVRSAPPIDRSAALDITTAIRGADLRCRAERGSALRTTGDYTHYKVEGDPSIKTIYNRFGNWPQALLAAQQAEHLHSANRRTRGGSRQPGVFPAERAERALLTYGERHAGRLPGKGDYERWLVHHPEMPSMSQMYGRGADKKNQRNWSALLEGARQRALDERNAWPLTRQRILLDRHSTR